jgi:hypothetical protein
MMTEPESLEELTGETPNCEIRILDPRTLKMVPTYCGEPAAAAMICSSCSALAGHICKLHLAQWDSQSGLSPRVKRWKSACCGAIFENQKDGIVAVLL